MTELWHTGWFKAFNKSQLAFVIPRSTGVSVLPHLKENNSQYFVKKYVLYLNSYSSSLKKLDML